MTEEFKVGFDKILIPVDFTEICGTVAKYGKNLARKLQAEVILLYVIEDIAIYEGLYLDPSTVTEIQKKMRESAEESIEKFIKDYFSDYPVKKMIRLGDIMEEILETVKEENIDLIIMGTHARKGLDKIIFGSVTEKVIKSSPVPVLVVNPYKV